MIGTRELEANQKKESFDNAAKIMVYRKKHRVERIREFIDKCQVSGQISCNKGQTKRSILTHRESIPH